MLNYCPYRRCLLGCGQLVVLLAALFGCARMAIGSERGWLNFADGNAISGELVRIDDRQGVFRSDRFGQIAFSTDEASFAAQPEIPEASGEIDAGTRFAADSWSISGSISSKDEDGEDEESFDIDLKALWDRDRDETTLQLRSEYEVKDREIDTNEQSARVRWNHLAGRRWFTMTQLYAERDTLDLLTLENIDYLLLQGAAGIGIEKAWSGNAISRFGIGYSRFLLDLRDFGVSDYVNAAMLFIENSVPISERASLTNWINAYDWDNGGTGYESETELDYAITDQFSIGIRHRYRENGATLRSQSLNEMKFFTRVQF